MTSNKKVAQARDRLMPDSCLWLIGLMDEHEYSVTSLDGKLESRKVGRSVPRWNKRIIQQRSNTVLMIII